MLSMQEIFAKFKSFPEYESFHKEWTKTCYLLNPTEENKKRLEHSEEALTVLGAGKESENG